MAKMDTFEQALEDTREYLEKRLEKIRREYDGEALEAKIELAIAKRLLDKFR